MNTKISITKALLTGAIAGGVSMAINAILFFIFRGADIITDNVEVEPGKPITVILVMFSSMLPSLIGAVVYYFFDKHSNHGFRNFTILAIVLMLATFANPFIIPNVPLGYAIALNVMHVVVAVSLLYFLNKTRK
jgi:Family of unknown function (DUF6069)